MKKEGFQLRTGRHKREQKKEEAEGKGKGARQTASRRQGSIARCVARKKKGAKGLSY